MDKSATSFLVLHYIVLLIVIFLVITAIEASGLAVPLWAGVLIAIVLGISYPFVVRGLGVAPEQWE